MIVVLLGPPGAGKGTQAARLAQAAGWIHVSTGDLFREHLRDDTPLGRLAGDAMRRGELVSDEVVIGMVQERLAEISGGVILDGFPRTVRQAQALDRISVGRSDDDGSRLIAFELEVPREELLRRLTGRRVCRAAGHVYHLEFNPPRAEGVCDVDGSALYQRDDDSAATAARRLAVYEEETAPVLGYYERSGRLARIDGTGSREGVQAAVLAALPPVAEPS